MTFFFAEIPAKAWLYNQLKFNNKAECFSPVKWNVVVQNVKFSIKILSNHWNRRRKGHGRTECEGGKEKVRGVATWESFQFILDVVSRIPHFCCKWNSVKPGSFTSWRSVRTFSLALINLGILVSNLKFLVWVSDSSEPQSNPRQAWGFFLLPHEYFVLQDVFCHLLSYWSCDFESPEAAFRLGFVCRLKGLCLTNLSVNALEGNLKPVRFYVICYKHFKLLYLGRALPPSSNQQLRSCDPALPVAFCGV